MFLLSVLSFMLLLVAVKDAWDFHAALESPYQTPWYSTNWLKQPYTNLRLSLLPQREFWTENATHTERWFVREVVIGDTTFWTIKESIPAG